MLSKRKLLILHICLSLFKSRLERWSRNIYLHRSRFRYNSQTPIQLFIFLISFELCINRTIFLRVGRLSVWSFWSVLFDSHTRFFLQESKRVISASDLHFHSIRHTQFPTQGNSLATILRAEPESSDFFRDFSFSDIN